MRYHNITKDDMLNGDGLRVVLWVAGCEHKCEGCHNPITWDPDGGLPFGEDEKSEIFTELDKPHISGITFTGGDPLYQSNINGVETLAKEIKEKYNLSIFMIEHHMDLVMQISDRIYVLDFGKTIASGTPEEIQENPHVIDAYLGVADDAEN